MADSFMIEVNRHRDVKKITFECDVTATIPFHVIIQYLICYGAGEKG
jgi:hypothetical protein